jgi:hypothetical protein
VILRCDKSTTRLGLGGHILATAEYEQGVVLGVFLPCGEGGCCLADIVEVHCP